MIRIEKAINPYIHKPENYLAEIQVKTVKRWFSKKTKTLYRCSIKTCFANLRPKDYREHKNSLWYSDIEKARNYGQKYLDYIKYRDKPSIKHVEYLEMNNEA